MNNPIPVPNLSGTANVCAGSQETYTTDSGAGESNYAWTVSGGTIVSGGTPTDPSIDILWDGTAPYEVSVNYSDANGCAATNPTALSVTVNPLPVPTIAGSASLCFGSTQIYSTESGSGETAYSWTVNGGTIVSGGTATDSNIEILWDGVAPYNVSINYIDVNGCTAASPTLLPIAIIPLPIPSLDGPGTVCDLSTEIYSTDSTAGQSNIVWNVSGGTIVGGGTTSDPSVSKVCFKPMA